MSKTIKRHFVNEFFLVLILSGIAISAEAVVNVQVLSATIKDQRIEGASVVLQKNGEQSVNATSDIQGQATLIPTFADDQSALLIIKKAGYSNLVVKCPCSGMTYAISSVMEKLDGIRIVLNWGVSPRDLDSHLVFPNNNHVYFMSKFGSDSLLDVDDRDGFGPETITINKIHNGERYTYAVHDFSNNNNPSLNTFSRSDAKVFVYIGQTLVKTYYAPSDSLGNLWTVFAITESGEIEDINSISGITPNLQYGTSNLASAIRQATAHPTALHSTANQEKSKEINKQGEIAYRAGNLDESIRLYQSAIELDGNYGQAYSNLGLAFQKAGRVAEAMWANRKAIALANGPMAATVRASSHFNNGKIYEAASQWGDALREYQYAKNEKAHPVYDKAIQRMQEKVGANVYSQ